MQQLSSDLPLIHYLSEIRTRGLRVLALYCLCFLIAYHFAYPIMHVLLRPLTQALPPQKPLVLTQITASFFIPMRLAANFALIMITPYALLQIWHFVNPALYAREQRMLFTTIITSFTLFIAGTLSCFYFILPVLMQFFVVASPPDVQLMPELSSTLDVITHMMFWFGLIFQIPLGCYAGAKLGLLTAAGLVRARPYVIVSAFVIGMLLTPPDVFSQILLAVPICLLFECGVFIVKKTR